MRPLSLPARPLSTPKITQISCPQTIGSHEFTFLAWEWARELVSYKMAASMQRLHWGIVLEPYSYARKLGLSLITFILLINHMARGNVHFSQQVKKMNSMCSFTVFLECQDVLSHPSAWNKPREGWGVLAPFLDLSFYHTTVPLPRQAQVWVLKNVHGQWTWIPHGYCVFQLITKQASLVGIKQYQVSTFHWLINWKIITTKGR